MSIIFKQSQFELFPGTQGAQARVDKPRFFFASLTLSIENLVVMSIVILMLVVLSFSLGVEKGKQVSRPRLREDQARAVPSPTVVLPVTQIRGMETKKASLPVNPPVVSTSGKPLPQTVVSPAVSIPADKKALQSSSPSVYSSPDSPSKTFTVQVASFKREEYARQEASLLKQKGFEIFVLSKGEHSVVCVGKFFQHKDAESFSTKLKKQYKDCLVRRL